MFLNVLQFARNFDIFIVDVNSYHCVWELYLLADHAFICRLGGGEGFVSVEQRPHREPGKAEPQGHTSDHLPRAGEERSASLESGGPQPDLERPQVLL